MKDKIPETRTWNMLVYPFQEVRRIDVQSLAKAKSYEQ